MYLDREPSAWPPCLVWAASLVARAALVLSLSTVASMFRVMPIVSNNVPDVWAFSMRL